MPQAEPRLLRKKLEKELLYHRALLAASEMILEGLSKDDLDLIRRGAGRREKLILKIRALEAVMSHLLGRPYPEALRYTDSIELKRHRELLALSLAEVVNLDREVERSLRLRKDAVRDELSRFRMRQFQGRRNYQGMRKRGMLLDRTT